MLVFGIYEPLINMVFYDLEDHVYQWLVNPETNILQIIAIQKNLKSYKEQDCAHKGEFLLQQSFYFRNSAMPGNHLELWRETKAYKNDAVDRGLVWNVQDL